MAYIQLLGATIIGDFACGDQSANKALLHRLDNGIRKWELHQVTRQQIDQ